MSNKNSYPKSDKVLIICPFARPNLGGVETHLDKLMNFLAKKEIFSYLLTYQPLTTNAKGERVEKGEYWEIHRVSWFGRGWFNKLEKYFPLVFLYLFPGLFIKSLSFYLKHHREIDCIHAHGFAAAMIVKILAAIYPVRIVISTHAVYEFNGRPLLAKIMRWVLASFDQILAVSEVSRKELIKIGLDSKKIKVHPNWIDLEQFSSLGREVCKKRLGLSGKTVLFVGRMIEKKGAGFLLKAATKLKDVSFVFVGSGPMEEEINTASKDHKNIIYVGPLNQDNPEELKKLIELYSAADLFACIPTYPEGFGAVYLEAVACGTPVLSSNLGSLPTFLDNSVSVLIDPRQSKVERAISKLFKSGRELKKLQLNCRAYAEKHFSDKNAQTILDSYNL